MTTRRLAVLVTAFSLASSLSSPAGGAALATTADERLREVLDLAWDDWMELHPTAASSLGDARFQDRLTLDLAPEYRERVRSRARALLTALDEIEPADLSSRPRIWRDAARWTMTRALAGLEHPEHLLPLQPGLGMPGSFFQLGSGSGHHRFRTEADYRDFLGRMEDFGTWCDQAVTRMEEGIEAGIVHPRAVVDRTLTELRPLVLEKDPTRWILWAPVTRFPAGLSSSSRARIETAWRKELREVVRPALERVVEFLETTYRDASRPDPGLAHLPDGKAWYRERVRFFTTTERTPDEIFALGEQEVQRILDEMDALRAEMEFEGSVGEFRHWMMNRSGTVIRGRGASLEAYEAVRRRVEPQLSSLFRRTPAAELEIRPVEPHRVASAPGAFYERPAPDGSRPGIFYVNLGRGGVVAPTVTALFLHEGLPGHHFQLARALEEKDLPRFLASGYFGAYIEGWGLYAESLGHELGVYDSPEARFGRLRFELGRAGRLLGDVGLHHYGWSWETAVRELQRRELDWAAGELFRYTVIPGQALAYKIGELKLLELREEASKALGDAFDLRDFHEVVLGDGPLPLEVLQSKIERWIEERSVK